MYGVWSLSLTIANIALIWISGMIMFRLKEVLPIKKKVFWEDLGVARKIYQGLAVVRSEEGESLRTYVPSSVTTASLEAASSSASPPEQGEETRPATIVEQHETEEDEERDF